MDSCWEQFGNSYQAQVADDMFEYNVFWEKKAKRTEATKPHPCMNQK